MAEQHLVWKNKESPPAYNPASVLSHTVVRNHNVPDHGSDGSIATHIGCIDWGMNICSK